MATFEKRINNKGVASFRVRIRIRGNPKQTATFNRLADARRWATQTEAAIQENRYFKSSEARKRTLSELITRYQIDVLPYKSESISFIRCQRTQLDWWKSQLGEYYLSDITAPRIIEMRNKLETSSSTKNRYMAALSHVFSVAVREWEWIDDSPIRKIYRLREPRGRVRYLSDEERERLLAIAKQRRQDMYLVIVLALATGARKNELLSLRWNDVDLERRKLVFQKTKNGERRGVPIGDYAVNALTDYKKLNADAVYVFSNSRGKPVRIDTAFRKLLLDANIENFRFHDLRHCAASYLAMNGASMTDIAEVLGHKTLTMVKRYTHLSDSHTASVVSKMNTQIFS